MAQCFGKNCKFNTAFHLPHSKECIADGTNKLMVGATEQDNSCGPNNIEMLNPLNPDVQAMGSAEYMKLLVLAMRVLDVDKVVITPELIEETDGDDCVVCIANMPDGIHISLVTMAEAKKIASEVGGVLS